jgi:signal peptidase I
MGYIVLVVTATFLSGCGGKSITVVVTNPSSAKANQLFPEHVYRVPSGSMEPTLSIGARVVVSSGALAVGEIVVFHPPEGSEQEECGPIPHVVRLGGAACVEPVPKPSTVKFIKRIVAAPGDEIYIREGQAYRKAAGSSSFAREPDSYTRPCGGSAECNFSTPIRVSAGHWYLLGDNRGESDDSRFWGAIPTSWIIGVVKATTPTGSPE